MGLVVAEGMGALAAAKPNADARLDRSGRRSAWGCCGLNPAAPAGVSEQPAFGDPALTSLSLAACAPQADLRVEAAHILRFATAFAPVSKQV